MRRTSPASTTTRPTPTSPAPTPTSPSPTPTSRSPPEPMTDGGRPSEAAAPVRSTPTRPSAAVDVRRPAGSRRKPWPPRAEAPSEGLAWLGRAPEAKASLLYRGTRLLVRFICFGLFRFRIATSGQELIPPGGYLLVAGAHRGWMDPLVVMRATGRAALLDPRQRTIDLHLEVARIPDPALGWAPAGLARRGRDRPARPDRLGPSWPRAPCSCRCPRGP